MTKDEQRRAIQRILGVKDDGIIGPKTEAAWQDLKQADPEFSKRFSDFMPFIFEWEGEGYEFDPADPGGETSFGIDKASHPGVNIKSLTKDGATRIYWEEWKDAGIENMPFPYGELFFNCAVNMGLARAKEFDSTAKGSAQKFWLLQEAKYKALGAQPSRAKYLKGWLNRHNAIRTRFGL